VSIIVLRGGLLTSVQDVGAEGYARYGVPERGALDVVSLRIANMLVGNRESAAALEITLDGPHLSFEHAARVAICGADLAPESGAPLPQWRPLDVGAGTILRLGRARNGARAYLAIAGGVDVPMLLGSRGTHLRAHFGGLDGRAIRAGDRIVVGNDGSVGTGSPNAVADGVVSAARWSVGMSVRTPLGSHQVVRIIPTKGGSGRSGIVLPTGTPLTVSPASDRMGIRFVESIGMHGRSITSEPAMIGAMQVPPDGRPIVLLAEHQTTGGYPIVAHVATVDLPRLGQLRAGASVRFEPIGIESAQRLLRERERELRRLSRWIELRRSA
jgi:antagonist of KipI